MNGANDLLEVSMGIDDFSSEWVHCDKISSYVARMVSHDRADSLLYANLLSSALNELLETVFANHGPEGDFSCRIRRQGAADVARPVDALRKRAREGAGAGAGAGDGDDPLVRAAFGAWLEGSLKHARRLERYRWGGAESD